MSLVSSIRHLRPFRECARIEWELCHPSMARRSADEYFVEAKVRGQRTKAKKWTVKIDFSGNATHTHNIGVGASPVVVRELRCVAEEYPWRQQFTVLSESLYSFNGWFGLLIFWTKCQVKLTSGDETLTEGCFIQSLIHAESVVM